MKKLLIMTVLVLLATTPAKAALSVVGSKHDMIFSGRATGDGSTEICVFCHTPHSAQVGVTQAPLWNIVVSGGVDSIVYNSPTLNFSTDETKVNATDARLCLSCHDSGVTLASNTPNNFLYDLVTPDTMGANTLLGLDMANDHPIGMDVGANPETNDVQYGVLGMHSIAEISAASKFGENPFYPVGGVNVMWCSSCHNVHDGTNIPFLRMSNVGSNMCKACHIK